MSSIANSKHKDEAGRTAKRSRAGRKRREVSPQMEKICLTLLTCGDSYKKIHAVTGIHWKQWLANADRNPAFKEELEKARAQRRGGVGALIRQSMMKQIARGHPWWAKLAIWNFEVGLVDPDRELTKMEGKARAAVMRQIDLFISEFNLIVTKECDQETAARISRQMANVMSLMLGENGERFSPVPAPTHEANGE